MAGSADTTLSEAAARVLPEGLSLSLELTERIDTSTAAAGDVVSAKITHAIRDPKSKATLILLAISMR